MYKSLTWKKSRGRRFFQKMFILPSALIRAAFVISDNRCPVRAAFFIICVVEQKWVLAASAALVVGGPNAWGIWARVWRRHESLATLAANSPECVELDVENVSVCKHVVNKLLFSSEKPFWSVCYLIVQ